MCPHWARSCRAFIVAVGVVARMRCFGVSEAQVEHRLDCQPVEVETLQREDEELVFMNVLLMI